VVELLEAAEAKAYYGLAVNWAPLQALVDALLERSVLTGKEVAVILERSGVITFPDPYLGGFGWDGETGELQYPLRPANRQQRPDSDDAPAGAGALQEDSAASAATLERARRAGAVRTKFEGTELDAPRKADGRYVDGWHWGVTPYSVRRDLPEWYSKELERYNS
jgi:cell division protease FtsH